MGKNKKMARDSNWKKPIDLGAYIEEVEAPRMALPKP